MIQPKTRDPAQQPLPTPELTDNYHLRWQSYARRRSLALASLFLWLPVCVALFAVSHFWLDMPVLSMILALLWLVAALALVWWQGEFRCPRCNRRYAALGHQRGGENLTRGLFDKVCANCKLRKFERASH